MRDNRPLFTGIATVAVAGVFTAMASCDSGLAAPEPDRTVLEVTASGHTAFELATDEVPSGWTTIRFHNQTHAAHFVIVERMPTHDGEQMTVEDSRTEVVPVFQNIMDDINGEDPRFPDAGFQLPEWYADVAFLGGPGLTSPGQTSETTLDLEPGTYVLECYVKTADGTFHSTEDMIVGLRVTDEASGDPAPVSDASLSISFGGGIQGTDDMTAGSRTVGITFTDQQAHEHFLGHDVHLARLGGSADLDELAAWMNWATPGGLAEPAPSGVEFLGGVQDMPAGSTAYMSVELTPGEYAWIAEVPDPAGKDMLSTFTVQ